MDPYFDAEDVTTVSKSASPSSKHFFLATTISIAVIALVFVSIELIGIFYAIDLLDVYVPEQREFQGNVNIFDIMEHLQEFEKIAQNFQSSRAMDLGYNASVSYVVSQLSQYPDYFPPDSITQQVFPVVQVENLEQPQFNQLSPSVVDYEYEIDFQSISYSGSGDITANMIFVGAGCTTNDYNSTTFTSGDIALALYTSDCSTSERAQMSMQMQAGGLLIYNDEEGLFSSSAKNPVTFPVFALSHEVGTELMHLQTTGNVVSLRLFSSTQEVTSNTINIIVDTPGGDDTNVIVSGSHLDSVPAGPGINDNGSGSAANLEIALQFARNNVNPTNKVRFAWWAAEELGLKGSTYYLDNLSQTQPTEVKNIAANVNYDMLGSPNFVRGIYNGSEAQENIRPGCEAITQLYKDFFIQYGIAYSLTPFTGRSDYGPFLDYDIPAGGLFSGAEVKKTSAERTTFGGISNASYDTCYHQSCDTVANINREALDQMAKAAASVVYSLAMDSDLRSFLQTVKVQ
uniref:Peptide hydrolase n=1 Tax=Vannella robusta TaxID=1487602 RepID=A0A7S4I823_9EUKA|mmetsp:Transcript_21828/g.27840  ORF Transcript_21828/g.27840 Transcript_21828/m.27840 type:complete len:515 (+) Transcript_21828:2-1546(+)